MSALQIAAEGGGVAAGKEGWEHGLDEAETAVAVADPEAEKAVRKAEKKEKKAETKKKKSESEWAARLPNKKRCMEQAQPAAPSSRLAWRRQTRWPRSSSRRARMQLQRAPVISRSPPRVAVAMPPGGGGVEWALGVRSLGPGMDVFVEAGSSQESRIALRDTWSKRQAGAMGPSHSLLWGFLVSVTPA